MSSLKRLISNSSWLLIAQFGSYILPVFLIPYLTQKFGVEYYGILAFGLSYIALTGVLIDFGFDLYFPYKISISKEIDLDKIIGAIFFIKIVIFFLVIIFTFLLYLFDSKFGDIRIFILFTIFPILSNLLQPNWFYAGIEKMSMITIPFLISRLAYVGLIFAFVKSHHDLNLVFVIMGITQFFAAIIGLSKIYQNGYRPVYAGRSYIFNIFKESFWYFLSRAFVAVYTTAGAFILGIYSDKLQTAIFYAAEQVYKGMQGIASPFIQALYPHMTKYKNFNLFKKYILFSIILGILSFLSIYYFGGFFIFEIFGKGFEDSQSILNLFAICFFINIISSLLGYPFLGALGYGVFVNKSVIVGGVFNILFLFSIIFFKFFELSAFVLCFSVLISETIVFILRIYKCNQINKMRKINAN